MKTSSPLRYPGGKSAMAGLLSQIRRANSLGALSIAEPFAGGAGASLSLLFQEETQEIFINDADPAIHDFWWSALRRPEKFQSLLSRTRVSMTEWRRQRAVYRSRPRSRLRRGFATFYLNRTNRSGIIPNGGPIGGIEQDGPWKLNARYNKQSLASRFEKLQEYRVRINESGMDGIEFISALDLESTMLVIDPPYYVKGKTLYLNGLSEGYHRSLATLLRASRRDAWVLTYDDCPQIRSMYQGWASIHEFTLRYTAADRRCGREILITPRWMKLPRSQPSEAIIW